MYENKEICSVCEDCCCKNQPGAYFPSDFGLPQNQDDLDKALKTGRYAIDWWEGDPREDQDKYDRGYFVRPAIKGTAELFHPAWKGECIFLNDDGCLLPEDKRPLNCKMLEPAIGSSCIMHGDHSKQGAAIAWIPYYKLLDSYRIPY